MTRIAEVWPLPPGSIRPTNAVVDALLVTTRPALANTPSVISQGCPPLHRDPGAQRGALGAEAPLLGAGGARPRPGGRLPRPGSHPRRRAHGPPPFVSGVSRDGRWASSSDRPRLGQQEPLRMDTEALVPAAQRPPSLPSRPPAAAPASSFICSSSSMPGAMSQPPVTPAECHILGHEGVAGEPAQGGG